ncbi:hypothetical protein QAD02_015007 [Eretmocerus hayati]|uniref:Uncharacterized protein n=1 Tax=Eretmocerus hayati TaxID=131215 RepID=A0ACC2P711_9HYME|nr:hypothetical protein QAD02_015007 [Eretmocerus hayati]
MLSYREFVQLVCSSQVSIHVSRDKAKAGGRDGMYVTEPNESELEKQPSKLGGIVKWDTLAVVLSEISTFLIAITAAVLAFTIGTKVKSNVKFFSLPSTITSTSIFPISAGPFRTALDAHIG